MTRRSFLLTVLAAAVVRPPKRSALLDARDLAKLRAHAWNYGMGRPCVNFLIQAEVARRTQIETARQWAQAGKFGDFTVLTVRG